MVEAWLVAVLGLLLVERGFELAVHRRNLARMLRRGARLTPSDGYRTIVAGQALLFGLVAVEATLAPWGGWHAWGAVGLIGLALAQVVRYWCIASLGDRWSVRVVTVPGEPPVRRGPYRWMRHPNYAVVLAEVVLLPLAFGAWIALAVVLPLKLVALGRRVRIEERAMADAFPASA